MDCPPSTDWLPDSPFRVPDYRWSRARWICHSRGAYAPLPEVDDEWVARAYRFLQSRDRVASGDSSHHEDSAIAEALRLSAEQAQRRWMLDALLLTAEPLADVACRVELPESVVQAYHLLLYCVRDRLACSDWIIQVCLGPGTWCGFTRDQLPYLWRAFAYHHGPRILDIIMAVSLDQPLPAWVRAPEGQNQPLYIARVRLSAQLAVATHMMQTPAEMRSIRKLYRAKERLDQAASEADQADRTIDAMLSLLVGIAGRRGQAARKRDGAKASGDTQAKPTSMASLPKAKEFIP